MEPICVACYRPDCPTPLTDEMIESRPDDWRNCEWHECHVQRPLTEMIRFRGGEWFCPEHAADVEGEPAPPSAG